MPDTLIVMPTVTAVAAFVVGWRGRAVAWRLSRRNRRDPAPVVPAGNSLELDPLRAIQSSVYERRALLSPRETRLIRAAEQSVRLLGLDWRVMARVRLDEALRTPDARAQAAVRGRRVDLMLVDSDGLPRAAIDAEVSRDAIKREALRRAGVAYVEIPEPHTLSDLHAVIVRIARAKPSASAAI